MLKYKHKLVQGGIILNNYMKKILSAMEEYKDDSSETDTSVTDSDVSDTEPDNTVQNLEVIQDNTVSTETVYPPNQIHTPQNQLNPIYNTEKNNVTQIINAASSISCYIGKQVKLPNYNGFLYINHDINMTPYLCALNPQTGFYDYPIGIIVTENGEYTVYKVYQNFKIGTLIYNNFEDATWFFVPIGESFTPHNYQNSNNAQPQSNNNPKYVFNNVPPEDAEKIISSILENKPQNSVEVNFASSPQHEKTDHQKFVEIQDNQKAIELSPIEPTNSDTN